MASQMLKLNDNETEYLVTGSRYMLRQVPESILSLKVDDKMINASPSARIVTDSILYMEHQVTNVCKACYKGIRDIGKIKHFLQRICQNT